MQYITAQPNVRKGSFPIAIVVSLFNTEITQALKNGALQRLTEYGFLENDILVVEVPGAVEIPIVVQQIAKSNRARAIIALGCVIRGETTHFDCVFEQVNYGCQRIALDYNLPIIFEVLMTENEEQALDRVGGNHGHKGVSAVDCAVDMVAILQQLNNN